MLAAWVEILPLFIVRWLALKYCERLPVGQGDKAQTAATARPDVLFQVRP